MSSSKDRDLADLRSHQLLSDIAETIDFCIEHLDHSRNEAMKGITSVESLPDPSPLEAEGDTKQRTIEALNAVFVHIYRCRQALGDVKIDI